MKTFIVILFSVMFEHAKSNLGVMIFFGSDDILEIEYTFLQSIHQQTES